jgi:hypothetical protein
MKRVKKRKQQLAISVVMLFMFSEGRGHDRGHQDRGGDDYRIHPLNQKVSVR